MKSEFGMIGLGTMGRALLQNIADKGFCVSGWNRNQERLDLMLQEAAGKDIQGFTDLAAFVESIRSPRVVMLLVPAGEATDEMIQRVLPLLAPGDFIIDGSNAYFKDTDRRSKALAEQGFGFLGLGVSGGETGARYGPSMMAGGTPENYERVRSMLEAAAAKYNGEPCVALLGPSSAGHYVKMVHNGIEYGIMQILAECYDLMRRGLGMAPPEMAAVVDGWDSGTFKSYLLEITAHVLKQRDDLTEGWLVDQVLDKAKAKGTGKWTSQNAMDLGVPVPIIDEAVCAREMSALKEERVLAADLLVSPCAPGSSLSPSALTDLQAAMEAATIIAYAQGLAQLRFASAEFGYSLNMEAVARVWRAGCIIRSELLEVIREAFGRSPSLANLLLDESIAEMIRARDEGLRNTVVAFVTNGIPCAALSSALAYLDAYRSAHLPANLTQAQRDLFGAHTYERTDRDGEFHTEWDFK
ncbi:MAG: NADP-dependent phosphogluconate dehydrogenase [Fimbriimonas sp.]